MYILSEILAVVAEVYTIHLFMLGSFYKRDRTILTWIFAYGLFGVLFVFLAFIPNGSYIRLLFCVVALVLISLSLFETTLLQSVYASLSFSCLYVLTDVLTIFLFSLCDIDIQAIMSYGIARSFVSAK